METQTMGRVVTEVMLENLQDVWAVKDGLIRPEEIRRIAVKDALVDTGATYLSLPVRIIRELGLESSSRPGTSPITQENRS